MSGIERLFDTNAAIAMLGGDSALLNLWRQGRWAGLSVISVLEFRAWPQMDAAGRETFLKFIERLNVIDLRHDDHALLPAVLKLRDAIVFASARLAGATLNSRHTRLLKAAEDAGMAVWHE